MSALGELTRHWLLKRIDKTIRIGGKGVYHGVRNQDLLRTGMGASMVLYGLLQHRRVHRLIYETSLDVDQGMSIRVMRGRRPIADFTPLP